MRYALLALLIAANLAAQPKELAVLLKGASALAFYTPDGKEIARTSVREHPHEMVYSKDGRYLYTTDNGTMKIEHAGTGGNFVSIIDVKARKKIGEIDLGKFRRPHGIDIDHATGNLLVSTELPDQLLLIDPQARKILRTFDTKGKTSHMVKLAPKFNTAFVSNSTSMNVAAIDLKTGDVKLIPSGNRPEGSALSPDGNTFFVCNREGEQIQIIDAARKEQTGVIKTGKGPVRIEVTPDNKSLVYAVMHDEAVEIADIASRKVIGKIQLKGPMVSLHLSPDGKFAFASAEDLDTVYLISLAERKLIKTMKLPQGSHPDPVKAVP